MAQHPSRLQLLLLSTAAALTLCMMTGCDSGPNVAPVKGRVTFEGKPIPEGAVTFYPVAGGRPATGRIQPDGSFELSFQEPGDGALVGEHKVTIEAKRVEGGAPGPQTMEDEFSPSATTTITAPGRVVWLVPEEYAYAQSSGLLATVESGRNEINFDLP